MEYIRNLWDLFVDMSFYLVIGIIFTGILHAFVKKETVLKHVGKDDTKSVVKASVVGVPLPLCSCGVVPTALYLGKNGASKGAVVSFLTSTPQTGVDSIIATYGMMGPFFAIFRAIAAFISGIFSGIVTNIICKKEVITYDNSKTSCGCSDKKEEAKTSGCCSHKKEEVKSASCCSHKKEEAKVAGCCSHKKDEAKVASCCSHKKEKVKVASCCSHKKEEVKVASCCSSNKQVEHTLSFKEKFKSIFTYGFGEFLDEIAVNFVIGLLIATLISTFIPEDFLAGITTPFFSMILMLIIGIPMYVCSTASIPIAISLIMKGMSPGAAFVFLFAGPVTNIASLSILLKSLGKKTMAVYLACVAVCSVFFGLLLDNIISNQTLNMIHVHIHHKPLYMQIIAILFGCLVLKSIVKSRLQNK
ncbi:hypothetical protein AN641_02330 [Candidatus Epulonipiscioides gigas]|nr:hypothetical protein AN641_02330 [Epulopiscium sp. SCG-C07WGA-EpuloA2]